MVEGPLSVYLLINLSVYLLINLVSRISLQVEVDLSSLPVLCAEYHQVSLLYPIKVKNRTPTGDPGIHNVNQGFLVHKHDCSRLSYKPNHGLPVPLNPV